MSPGNQEIVHPVKIKIEDIEEQIPEELQEVSPIEQSRVRLVRQRIKIL